MGLAKKFFLVQFCFQLALCLPSCVNRNTGCRTEAGDVISTEFSVNAWTDCLEMCLKHGPECKFFVWYSPDSSPLSSACQLIKKLCADDINCDYCVSGPSECDTCSIGWPCKVTADNIISQINNIENELSCQKLCQDNAECRYYSYYEKEDLDLPETCFLLNSCTDFTFCSTSPSTCHTGPKGCRFNEPCQAHEAFFVNPKPTTEILISYSTSMELVTMGCQAKMNILAVGGGAASGSDDYYYRKGGGGSGYVALVEEVVLPYSTRLDVTVGAGGMEYHGYESMNGKATIVIDEDKRELIRAEGGKVSTAWVGGMGYSGGGGGCQPTGNGGYGGSNGSDGFNSTSFQGGQGSNVSVETYGKGFSKFVITAGLGGRYEKEYGGGGGGIVIDGNVHVGQGNVGQGHGAGGARENGVRGVILMEINLSYVSNTTGKPLPDTMTTPTPPNTSTSGEKGRHQYNNIIIFYTFTVILSKVLFSKRKVFEEN